MLSEGRSSSSYCDWTQDRPVNFFGTNDGARRLAFQTWHHFKEAFTPEFIKYAVDHSKTEVATCIDPLGGSGTTALTCQMLGIECTTIEVNPLLADVIRAKLLKYNTDRLSATLHGVRRKARQLRPDATEYFGHTPPTFVEPGNGGRWLFDLTVAERLQTLF